MEEYGLVWYFAMYIKEQLCLASGITFFMVVHYSSQPKMSSIGEEDIFPYSGKMPWEKGLGCGPGRS